MPNGRPSILDITEEHIFKTLGRGVPMCELLNGAESNTIKSNSIIEQAIQQMPDKNKDQIRGLEVIKDREKINLEAIRIIRKELKC